MPPAHAIMIKNCGRELKRCCRLFDTPAGTAGANFARIFFFCFIIFCGVYRRMPSAAANCQSSLGNSLGKYSRCGGGVMANAVSVVWRN